MTEANQRHQTCDITDRTNCSEFAFNRSSKMRSIGSFKIIHKNEYLIFEKAAVQL